jgi:predicted cupin superfamily sugar epimerase
MLTERARQLEKRYNEDWPLMDCRIRANFVFEVFELAQEVNVKKSSHQAALLALLRFAPQIGIQFPA